MKKVILLFVLLLPMPALGDPGMEKLSGIMKELIDRTETLGKMQPLLRKSSPADAQLVETASLATIHTFEMLSLYVLLRTTVLGVGLQVEIKDPKISTAMIGSYKAAHQQLEFTVQRNLDLLTRRLVFAVKPGPAGEVRDARNLLQKAKAILKEVDPR